MCGNSILVVGFVVGLPMFVCACLGTVSDRMTAFAKDFRKSSTIDTVER